MSSVHVPATPLPRLPGVVFRPYRGLEEIDGMSAANEALRRTVGILEPVDAALLRNAYEHLINSDPLVDCLVVEVDGRTVGYGRVEWHDLNDGSRVHQVTTIVEPSVWGRGIGRALHEWGEARLLEIAGDHPTDAVAWFETETYGGDLEAEEAAAALGYVPVRRWVEMLRERLDDPLPDVALPPEYAFRAVGHDDRRLLWDLAEVWFRDHFGEWEAGDEGFAEWMDDARQDPGLYVVAFAGDEPVSFVLNVLEDGPDGRRGLLDAIATHPDHRRRGLARACIARSLHLLRDLGATSAYLGVDTENVNEALALYESCGFRTTASGIVRRRPFPGGST